MYFRLLSSTDRGLPPTARYFAANGDKLFNFRISKRPTMSKSATPLRRYCDSHPPTSGGALDPRNPLPGRPGGRGQTGGSTRQTRVSSAKWMVLGRQMELGGPPLLVYGPGML